MTLMLSLLLASTDPAHAEADAVHIQYSILVYGPGGEVEATCTDPCHIDQHQLTGHSGGEMTTSSAVREADEDPRADGIKCTGTCASGKPGTTVEFNARKALYEGIEVRIEERYAHFIFYSVVDTEEGPSTLKQHAEFRIDRPLIQLDLHGHEIEVRAVMSDGTELDTPTLNRR